MATLNAATNKCLAENNKVSDKGKATNKRRVVGTLTVGTLPAPLMLVRCGSLPTRNTINIGQLGAQAETSK
jgi:hypothetical protein